MMWRDVFFEFEDGLIDEVNEGTLFCPVCRCCSLKQTPKFIPSIFTQAEMLERGEEWTPKEEDMGWVCSGGCTKTERHT
jgi:hypothetical protein